jgi:hypothetical protein
MMQFALKANGVRQVLQRLSLGGDGAGESQAHPRIVAFIQEKGADQFLGKLQAGPGPESPAIPPPAAGPSPFSGLGEEPKPPQAAMPDSGEAARNESGGKEQRRHPRFETNLAVTSLIKPSESSSSCFESSGRICDASVLGLCLIVPNLPRRWYSALCRSRGYVAICAQLPGQEQESQIKGTIAWMDYHGDDAEPYCRMGVDLGRSDEGTKAAVLQMVGHLAN